MKIKAQSGKVVFTGRVLDEETHEPVPYLLPEELLELTVVSLFLLLPGKQ